MNRIIRNYATSSIEMFAQREFFGQQLTVHRQSWLEYALPQQLQAAVVRGQWTVGNLGRYPIQDHPLIHFRFSSGDQLFFVKGLVILIDRLDVPGPTHPSVVQAF